MVARAESDGKTGSERVGSGLRQRVTDFLDKVVFPEVPTWIGVRGPGVTGMLQKWDERKTNYQAGSTKETQYTRKLFGVIAIPGIKPRDESKPM